MARIAMVTKVHTGVTNGVATSVAQSSEGLRALGHEVDIFAPWHPDAPALEPHVCRLPSWALTREYRIVKPTAWWTLVRQLASGRYDLVHVHHLPSPLCLVACLMAWLLGIPRVVTYHTYLEEYAHYVPYLRLAWAERLMAWFTTHLPKLYTLVIAPSLPIKEKLRDRYRVQQRIEVLPTGIDPQRYRIRATREFVQSLGIDPNRPIVMYVGRVAKEKNLLVLLRAFARIARSDSAVQLVIIGGGPELGALKSYTIEVGIEDRVVFTGMVDRSMTPSLFGWATIFVSASKSETQGITNVEAAAAGVARVGMAVNGVLDAFEHDVDGWLVSPGSPEHEEHELFTVLTELLYDLGRRYRYGRDALAMSARYDERLIARKLSEFYHEEILRAEVGA